MLRIKSDKIVTDGRLIDGYIYINGNAIVGVETQEYPADQSADYTGLYVSPGLIDVHTHGGGGYDFLDGSTLSVEAACGFHLAHGVTALAPTVSAAEISVMEQAAVAVAEVKEKRATPVSILGVHLEGPYLSSVQCGAQCPRFITEPKEKDYRRIVERLGPNILRWTYAPERDTGGTFCRFITRSGITASAGHTDAKYSDMMTAIQNGCTLITHLYSCTSTITRDHGFRSLGVVESAYLRDELAVELIGDGRHLPAELIQMVLKIKGSDNVLLVSDSLAITGTDAVKGRMGATDFIVEDGVCKLCDRSAFAGSIVTGDAILRFMTGKCGLSVPAAVRLMTETPAKQFKLKKGHIRAGYDADIIVFDNDINICVVYVGGSIYQYKRRVKS